MMGSTAARALHDEIRRRVLRRVLRTDTSIASMFGDLARRLRTRLRAFGASEAEVARVLEEEFTALERRLMPQVEENLEAAAADGNEAARRTLELIRGADRVEGGRVPFVELRGSRRPRRLVLWLLSGSAGG